MSTRNLAVAAAAGAALASAIFLLLPNYVAHLAPAVTPATLPPAAIFNPLIDVIAAGDGWLRLATPPNLYLFRHVMGAVHTAQLHTAARLRLADHIAGASAPMTSFALARAATNCSADCTAVALRLRRVLSAMAAYRVFEPCGAGGRSEDVATDGWCNTPASAFLAENHPQSLRSTVLTFGDTQFRMLVGLPDTVVTGESAFSAANGGAEFWSWYRAHPEQQRIFDETMTQLGKLAGADAAIASDYAFNRYAVVVDVGGGYGDMLATILRATGSPHRCGVLFDQPHVIAEAQRRWLAGAGAGGVRDGISLSRVALLGGDMFKPETLPRPGDAGNTRYFDWATAALTNTAIKSSAPQPTRSPCADSVTGPYAFVLRDIVHDWTDEDTVAILRSLASVMRPATSGDRVVLVARVLRPGVPFVKSFGSDDADTVMLAAFGTTAGERTEAHFRRLLGEAGLTLLSSTPSRSHYFMLEAARST